MRLAIAQINSTVGNFEGNLSKIKAAVERAKAQNADLLALPNNALTGCPLDALATDNRFEATSRYYFDQLGSLQFPIAMGHNGHAIIITNSNTEACNSIKLNQEQTMTVVGDSTALPPSTPNTLVIETCSTDYPHFLSQNTPSTGCRTIRVNMVGGNSSHLYPGGSTVYNAIGQPVQQLALFAEDFALIDTHAIATAQPIPTSNKPRIAMLHDALMMGIRDYMAKSGFTQAALGLSGGIDSAVVLALLHNAIGPNNIRVLLMPSQYSSQHSIDDSLAMVRPLGIQHDIVNIAPLFDTARQSLSDIFAGRPENVAEENIQARMRGVLLMALSNKFGHIILNTTNKSEAAVGYGTLYGDTNGAISVLGDVYKNDVYALARYINRNGEIIPQNIIDKAPSAELRPNQKDSDSLPPYDVLDALLYDLIEGGMSSSELKQKYDSATVERIVKLVWRNVYKRAQIPAALWVSAKPLTAKPLPLVNSWLP